MILRICYNRPGYIHLAISISAPFRTHVSLISVGRRENVSPFLTHVHHSTPHDDERCLVHVPSRTRFVLYLKLPVISKQQWEKAQLTTNAAHLELVDQMYKKKIKTRYFSPSRVMSCSVCFVH